MSIYIGEPKTITISDMQGPCPDGFHVPLSSEWTAIIDAGESLGAWNSDNGTNISTYLKMPMAGLRGYDTNTAKVGSKGYYWSSSPRPYNADYAYGLCFYTSFVAPENYDLRSIGRAVRCLQNFPTIPTSYWTKLYGTSIESGGIFHNPTDGLISISSDGSTWYTLMDKNLGATTVYNYGDTLTDANCGNVFQWGNNYAFPGTKSSASITTSSTSVDTTGYGPGNYYNSSTWIKYSGNWSNPANNNLRGGVSQGTSTKTIPQEVQNIYIGEYEPDFATRGPAPKGFHVPLTEEWQGLKTIMDGLSLTTGVSWRKNLHIPFAGSCYQYGTIEYRGSIGRYWSSSPSGAKNTYSLSLDSSNVNANSSSVRTYGNSIRCFKNSFEVPTSSWTVINGTLLSAGIFWNQADGLISITSNGTTGYTIQDKNLGATTVYNYRDTLTQDNMGNLYQWGNNYGFSSVSNPSKTSSTQVDTSNYGPGNYYNSDTFITGSGTYDWSNPSNDNLRGGVDGNVPV